MKHPTILLAAALLSLIASAAGAAEVGVWQGTIGDHRIRACFGTGTDDNGAYYYLDHLAAIHLQRQETQTEMVWEEKDPDAKRPGASRWALRSGADGELSGSWTSGGKSLPIRLTRVAIEPTKDDLPSSPCGSMAFMAPRLPKIAIRRAPAVLDGVAYSRLIFDPKGLGGRIEIFELAASQPGDARINAELRKTLPTQANIQDSDLVSCLQNSLKWFAEEGEYVDQLRLHLLTARWLVTERITQSFCGGAHPDLEQYFEVWNRQTGQKVNPWTWFVDREHEAANASSERARAEGGSRLEKLIGKHWGRDDEGCDDVPTTTYAWDIHPLREGMAFFPELAHVSFACAEDAIIPYRELAPLLTLVGKAAVASIEEDLRALPKKDGKPAH